MITSNIHLAKNDELASDILKNITPTLDLAEKLKTSLIRIMIKIVTIYSMPRRLLMKQKKEI